MRRVFPAALAACILLAGAALWARQQSPATPASATEIEHRVESYLRHYYAWGPAFTVKADAPEPSLIPDLYKVPVVVSYQPKGAPTPETDRAVVFVSHNGRYLIRGALSDMLTDPFEVARNALAAVLPGHPYIGPAKACVNVVEFSDYECPHCRAAQPVMKQLEKQYPQVRFTFINFPLTEIHPWAMNGALAARCAFQQNPADFLKMRDEIFANQDKITPDNAYNMLTTLATQAGLNASTLQACMASPATRKRVNADIALGEKLGVNATPTMFVNGRPAVGGNPVMLNQFISYELAQCGKAKPETNK
jgi:protein-disulfide isomerase